MSVDDDLPEDGVFEDEDEDEDHFINAIEDETNTGQQEVTVPETCVVDGLTLIRVGRQSVKVHLPAITSAPAREAKTLIHTVIRRNLHTTDKTRIGIDSDNLGRIHDDLKLQLDQSLVEHGTNVIRRCDYTGLKLVWPVSPQTLSLEAFYPFTRYNGQLLYHSSPNVGLVMSSLNYAKSRSSSLMLPLLSAWLTTMEDDEFETRLSQGAWIMNALGNMSVLELAFQLHVGHRIRIRHWSTWSLDKQKDVLSVLRTGEKTHLVDEALMELQDKQIPRLILLGGRVSVTDFLDRHGDRFASIQEFKVVYANLIAIAKRYGVSKSDFETCCTIPRPSGNDRVFYPYHVLSQSQAIAIGWDWHILVTIANATLCNMREKCNKNAEIAGEGEPLVDVFIYIYWICHHICHEIRKVKTQRP